MDTSPFAVTLLMVTLPIVAALLAAAWLGRRGIGRIRVVDRAGRVLVEVILRRSAGGD